MPTTLDCEVLGDLFGTAELRAVFDSRALVQGWLDAERALAEAEGEVGVIPADAAQRIAAECDASLYDLAALRAGISASKHPLVPLVRALGDRAGEHGGWVHWGATTQDIVDTGLVLQVRSALTIVGRDLDRAIAASSDLASRFRDTPMAGRTHGQHAVPITFGLKAATWVDELGRCRDRIEQVRAGLTVQLSGAAGTLATLGDSAAAVQEAFARRLSLARPDVHWHTTRDRPRDLGHALAQLAAAGERIAAEVVRLESTEIGEAAEPSSDAHVGSSTMPQKRNPMTCEYLIAASRLLRGATGVLADSPPHAFERDMGYWAVEWIAVPQALILASGVVGPLAQVLEGLEVDPERMRRNLELSGGAIMAEAVMMALGRELGHERAHSVVKDASRRAAADGRPLLDVLLDEPEVAQRLSRAELERVMDPATYTGLAGPSADEVRLRRSLDP